MASLTCRRCDAPIEGQAALLGNRPYCRDCYAKLTRNRRAVWWAGLPGVLVMVTFVALVALVLGRVQPHLEGTPLLVAGVIAALVPALFWLAFFYAQDVREPEPKQLVLGVFALGALLAQAVGLPLTRALGAPGWFSAGPLFHILGAILVVGFIRQFLVYAAVRYTVYLSAEFDERIDGVIYATAAALGYGTLVNVDYVIASGGVDLAMGIIRVAVTTLALAGFGGIVGYFLGRCKFEDEPAWWMPSGLALAAVLDGLFTYFQGEITTTRIGLPGGGYNPWPALLLAGTVTLLTFAVLFYLARRLEQRDPQVQGA